APVLLAVIPRLGFADAERLMVVAGFAVAAVAVLLGVRRGPLAAKPVATAGGTLVPLKRWHFWSISAPFAFVLMSQVGFLTHLVPMIAGRGN
ncbi:hypothetical protein ABTN35_20155, partial [Acinetobacter baumannii]